MKGVLFVLFTAAAIAGTTATAQGQYMYLDSNGDGVSTFADVMAPNGIPTTVDVWIRTDQNRDGSPVVCGTEPENQVLINSYSVNLEAFGGMVTYTNFINRQSAIWNVHHGEEINTDNVHYWNAWGSGVTSLPPGVYQLATLTITGLSGTARIDIVDLIPGSPDHTAFGSRLCSGNYFDYTLKLDGPHVPMGDWFDWDGLGAANQAPTADAGGPYTGAIHIPVQFDGTGSSDPEGDALSYSWDFGDGIQGSGSVVSHTYQVIGSYLVALTVQDPLSESDTDHTTAEIIDDLGATVFTAGGDKTIRLGSGKPTSCVQIEPLGDAFQISEVDLASIRMTRGGTSIQAISDKTTTGGDKNGNGVDEITACFSKQNLRILFGGLPTGDYEVTVGGDLISGGSFAGTVTLRVIGSGGGLAATISPTPLNPKATLTFATTKPGMVKVQMFDVQGRLIRTLMDESNAAAGYHDVEINGHDANGSRLASGIYYVKIRSSVDGDVTKAVTILK